MNYAKRTRTGSYKTVSDITDATDVILGIGEYEALQMKIIKMENSTYSQQSNEVANIKTELEQQRDAIIKEFSWAEKNSLEKHEREVQALQAEITALQNHKIALIKRINSLKDSYQEQKSLNSNLIRIARERANADRGIPGKKIHSGYLVLGSAQYRERVYDSGMDDDVAVTWRTTLQTPYDASIEFSAARTQIQADLMEDVFSQLGIAVVPQVDNEDAIVDWYETDDDGNEHPVCGIFRMVFAADFRGGYLTVDIFTNMPVTVPTELRPVGMAKKTGKR